MNDFYIIEQIDEIETIAASSSIRDNRRLRRAYGQGRWRKLKGTTTAILPDGTIRLVEVHWYEAHGIGRREFKIKRILD
ncbi:MAG: hypothetical protein OXI16_10380 [Chloroflexota bacterium]|nr:hypothetical protein [Chloroflexota bacterium]MDE2687885.1 hypothetical protein [Chloroflexota bacterium]MYC07508.1 hypothetical protein [Chloroflexota bacterium]